MTKREKIADILKAHFPELKLEWNDRCMERTMDKDGNLVDYKLLENNELTVSLARNDATMNDACKWLDSELDDRESLQDIQNIMMDCYRAILDAINDIILKTELTIIKYPYLARVADGSEQLYVAELRYLRNEIIYDFCCLDGLSGILNYRDQLNIRLTNINKLLDEDHSNNVIAAQALAYSSVIKILDRSIDSFEKRFNS